MKISTTKKLLCLLLILGLFVTVLLGCQTSGDDSTAPADGDTLTIPGKDWIPPELIEQWEQGLGATPEDTYYTVDLQWAAEKMNLEDTWDLTTGSSAIRVGVIDTGVDASHPELQNRVNEALSESFIPGVSPLEDPVGHGTHVAGIIGAQGNNEAGITGVCWEVEIVSLRVCDDNGIPDAEAFIAAIESANSKGIHILNISIFDTGSAYADEFRDAISDFEGLVVCIAGNKTSMQDPIADNDVYSVYPGNLQLDNLISVGASTNADTVWSYSRYGATTVDIFAPGNSILSCYPTQLCLDGECNSIAHNANGYHLMSGTSMAAPHVTGVAALLLSIHPELTPAELKQAIMDGADIVYDENLNSIFGDKCVSGGRLNAYKALTTSSIHNFGLWSQYDASYHARTCRTCGYVEYGLHRDYWNNALGVCRACGHSGPSTASLSCVHSIAELPKCA